MKYSGGRLVAEIGFHRLHDAFEIAGELGVPVQYGGGLRSAQAVSDALQAGAASINLEMKLAAARAIADLAPADELVPNALDQEVHDAVSRVVREAAERSGVARPQLAAQL